MTNLSHPVIDLFEHLLDNEIERLIDTNQSANVIGWVEQLAKHTEHDEQWWWRYFSERFGVGEEDCDPEET